MDVVVDARPTVQHELHASPQQQQQQQQQQQRQEHHLQQQSLNKAVASAPVKPKDKASQNTPGIMTFFGAKKPAADAPQPQPQVNSTPPPAADVVPSSQVTAAAQPTVQQEQVQEQEAPPHAPMSDDEVQRSVSHLVVGQRVRVVWRDDPAELEDEEEEDPDFDRGARVNEWVEWHGVVASREVTEEEPASAVELERRDRERRAKEENAFFGIVPFDNIDTNGGECGDAKQQQQQPEADGPRKIVILTIRWWSTNPRFEILGHTSEADGWPPHAAVHMPVDGCQYAAIQGGEIVTAKAARKAAKKEHKAAEKKQQKVKKAKKAPVTHTPKKTDTAVAATNNDEDDDDAPLMMMAMAKAIAADDSAADGAADGAADDKKKVEFHRAGGDDTGKKKNKKNNEAKKSKKKGAVDANSDDFNALAHMQDVVTGLPRAMSLLRQGRMRALSQWFGQASEIAQQRHKFEKKVHKKAKRVAKRLGKKQKKTKKQPELEPAAVVVEVANEDDSFGIATAEPRATIPHSEQQQQQQQQQQQNDEQPPAPQPLAQQPLDSDDVAIQVAAQIYKHDDSEEVPMSELHSVTEVLDGGVPMFRDPAQLRSALEKAAVVIGGGALPAASASSSSAGVAAGGADAAALLMDADVDAEERKRRRERKKQKREEAAAKLLLADHQHQQADGEDGDAAVPIAAAVPPAADKEKEKVAAGGKKPKPKTGAVAQTPSIMAFFKQPSATSGAAAAAAGAASDDNAAGAVAETPKGEVDEAAGVDAACNKSGLFHNCFLETGRTIPDRLRRWAKPQQSHSSSPVKTNFCGLFDDNENADDDVIISQPSGPSGASVSGLASLMKSNDIVVHDALPRTLNNDYIFCGAFSENHANKQPRPHYFGTFNRRSQHNLAPVPRHDILASLVKPLDSRHQLQLHQQQQQQRARPFAVVMKLPELLDDDVPPPLEFVQSRFLSEDEDDYSNDSGDDWDANNNDKESDVDSLGDSDLSSDSASDGAGGGGAGDDDFLEDDDDNKRGKELTELRAEHHGPWANLASLEQHPRGAIDTLFVDDAIRKTRQRCVNSQAIMNDPGLKLLGLLKIDVPAAFKAAAPAPKPAAAAAPKPAADTPVAEVAAVVAAVDVTAADVDLDSNAPLIDLVQPPPAAAAAAAAPAAGDDTAKKGGKQGIFRMSDKTEKAIDEYVAAHPTASLADIATHIFDKCAVKGERAAMEAQIQNRVPKYYLQSGTGANQAWQKRPQQPKPQPKAAAAAGAGGTPQLVQPQLSFAAASQKSDAAGGSGSLGDDNNNGDDDATFL